MNAAPALAAAPAAATTPLTAPAQIAVDLHNGWSCSFHFKETLSGRYAGVAAIFLRGLPSGSLVIMPQPSMDAAIARVKLCAGQFARERSPPRG
ncbi:hypothetical protein DBV14_25050 [Variovorax sp. KBW07]|uniref:hypothetical protein n=1 Tax=Variovorax sp. KBW07 TaxID=2153358 RepID=UPI000F562923|nr:hypothetical protein [Variovorax sp. KBW07]RQO44195.1 hypothetical protein DBV14_25050 [Variovorax sp. KBW07]